MILGFPDRNGMTLLEDLMYCNQGFECLHFVGEDGLPGKRGGRHISHPIRKKRSTNSDTYTFMPAQNALEDL
jgi:hypothetical protein